MMNEWVSVKDRLPDEIQSEVFISSSDFLGVAIYTGRKWYLDKIYLHNQINKDLRLSIDEVQDYFCKNITHWMPFPKLPEVKVES